MDEYLGIIKIFAPSTQEWYCVELSIILQKTLRFIPLRNYYHGGDGRNDLGLPDLMDAYPRTERWSGHL
jgi:microcystin-dependent protein